MCVLWPLAMHSVPTSPHSPLQLSPLLTLAAQHEPTSGPLCLLCIPGTLSSPGLSLSPLRAKHSCHLSGPSSCPPVHLTLTPQPSYLLQHSSTILHSSRSFLSPAARVEALGLQEFLCTVSPDPQITAGTPYLLNN